MSELDSPTSAGEQVPPPVAERPPVAEQQASSPKPPVYVPPPPRAKSRTGSFFLGALSGCLLVFFGLIFFVVFVAVSNNDSGELSFAANKVAIVPIEGEIVDAREAVELLDKYVANVTVKAIVIRINSPGGAIAPSQEIYAAIRRARHDSGKPIVASLDSVAASGGFYIASACDTIVANPGSITGSIGVILQWFDVEELMKWAKLKPETITSGALKDAGSPYRQLTDAERAYFHDIVTQLHSQFVRDVVQGRHGKLKLEEVQRIADGRVFTGEQALQLKLVDQLGSLDDAVRTAAKAARIEGKPARIWPKRREGTLFDLLAGNRAESMLERVVSRRIPRFMYRW